MVLNQSQKCNFVKCKSVNFVWINKIENKFQKIFCEDEWRLHVNVHTGIIRRHNGEPIEIPSTHSCHCVMGYMRLTCVPMMPRGARSVAIQDGLNASIGCIEMAKNERIRTQATYTRMKVSVCYRGI